MTVCCIEVQSVGKKKEKINLLKDVFFGQRNHNSPVLQFGAPPAIDSGEVKIRTASWENVDKHMP